MWLLFLVNWYLYTHCDALRNCTTSCSLEDYCINAYRGGESYCRSTPGYCCCLEFVTKDCTSSYSSDTLVTKYEDKCIFAGLLLYIPQRTLQLTPFSTPVPTPEFTPARTYAKLSVKCHSKTETDLAVTLATALFQ